MSVVGGEAKLTDNLTPPAQECPILFPQVPPEEIQQAIESLPKNKESGSNTIPNELLKIVEQQLLPVLTPIFNTCLMQGHYPTPWETYQKAIIQKANNEDYSNPSSYQPIALLSTLGKLFKKIINNCLSFLSTTKEILHPGHMGENREGN
ncbi:hypothetical protein O181_113817 [Austropuccinia psidii MF-1]|uniref:Reverse transcriptase domain-containing protein n=1 Tax=Austropuccinia psidii MF-1 TaxID=1389203 RepID=A0A9Q3PVR8_9BASI|nr:hypothetical protein [Austropuccinia psidii MF-1]